MCRKCQPSVKWPEVSRKRKQVQASKHVLTIRPRPPCDQAPVSGRVSGSKASENPCLACFFLTAAHGRRGQHSTYTLDSRLLDSRPLGSRHTEHLSHLSDSQCNDATHLAELRRSDTQQRMSPWQEKLPHVHWSFSLLGSVDSLCHRTAASMHYVSPQKQTK